MGPGGAKTAESLVSQRRLRYKREVAEGSAESEVEGEQPYRGERQTRLSGAWTALVIGIVILVVQGQLPLAVALLFAMILGAVVVLAFGAGRILQLRLVARRARHKGAPAAPPAPAKPPAK